MCSGFLLQFEGFKFWVTAGHCLREFEAKLEKYGAEQIRANWVDNDNQNEMLIPANLTDLPFIYFDDDDNDFGCVYLPPFVARMFEANEGTVFLDPTVWHGNELAIPEGFFLLGFPSHRVEQRVLSVDENKIATIGGSFDALCAIVDPLEANESNCSSRFFRFPDMFYAKLRDFDVNGKLKSIAGTSGGPIFSIEHIGDEFKYRLHAIQSAWAPEKGWIRATPIELFDEFLRNVSRQIGLTN